MPAGAPRLLTFGHGTLGQGDLAGRRRPVEPSPDLALREPSAAARRATLEDGAVGLVYDVGVTATLTE